VTFLLVHPGHVKTEMGEAGGRKVGEMPPGWLACVCVLRPCASSPHSLTPRGTHINIHVCTLPQAPMNVDEGVRQTLQNVVLRCGKQDSGHFFNYDGSELSF
jgi:hypothetical protein